MIAVQTTCPSGFQMELPSPRPVRVVLDNPQIARAIKEWETSGGSASANPCPPDFLCPLSLDIMVDPVVIASGHSYERAYIQRWLEEHRTCPKTNQRLPDLGTRPNVEARTAIRQWCKIHGVSLPTEVEVDENILKRPSFRAGLLESASGRLLLGSRINSLRQQMSGALNPGSSSSRSRLPSTDGIHSVTGARSPSTSGSRSTDGVIRPGSGPGFEFLAPRSQSLTAPSISSSNSLEPTRSSGGSSRSMSSVGLSSGGYSRSSCGVEPDPTVDDIKACVDRASVGGVEDKEEVVKQLRAMSRISRATRVNMARSGAIPVLVLCCSIAIDREEMVENAVTALLNLAGEMELKKPVALAGAVPVLVDLLQHGDGSKAQENAAGAISNLSIHVDNRPMIQRAGAIPHLKRLGVQCTSERTQRDAIIALFNLSINTDCRTEIIEIGTMEDLVEVLELPICEVEEEAALLLSNLVKCISGCDRFLNMGGVPAVANILEGTNGRAKGHTAAILLTVATLHPAGLQVVKNEVVLASLAVVAENGTARGQEKVGGRNRDERLEGVV